MNTTDHSERIDRFLKNQMTPEENEAFLHDLDSDEELREQAQITALMIQELQERQAKEDAEIIEEVLASKKKAKVISMVKWVGSIAAIFILLFGATQLWNKQPDTNALFTEYYTPYNPSSVRGGDDEAVKKELAELYNKVGTEKDITSIIARLQTIYDNIQLNSNDYSDYSYYKNDIAWYLALAYIKNNNVGKAEELLKPLADLGIVEAERLLLEISSMK